MILVLVAQLYQHDPPQLTVLSHNRLTEVEFYSNRMLKNQSVRYIIRHLLVSEEK